MIYSDDPLMTSHSNAHNFLSYTLRYLQFGKYYDNRCHNGTMFDCTSRSYSMRSQCCIRRTQSKRRLHDIMICSILLVLCNPLVPRARPFCGNGRAFDGSAVEWDGIFPLNDFLVPRT